MSGGLEIRPFAKLAEFRACVDLQRAVWGYADQDLIPATHLLVSAEYGAILLGAFDAAGSLEGFVYSFPGRFGGEWVQYSRMLGVRPGNRNHGLGARLKASQARRALREGFTRMHWTFDPLERLNSHFNLSKLGVEARTYHVDLYGPSSSELHRGLATDRFLAEWDLTAAERTGRLAALLEEESRGAAPPEPWAPSDRDVLPGAAIVLARREKDGGPGAVDPGRDDAVLLVEIPWDIQAMKRESMEAAKEWRLASREALVHYLGCGWSATGFRTLRDERRAFHVLRRRAAGAPGKGVA